MATRYESDKLMDDEMDMLKSIVCDLDGESCILKHLVSSDGEPYISRMFFGEGDRFDPEVPYEERELEIEVSLLLARGKGLHQQNFKLIDGEIASFYVRNIEFPVEIGDVACNVSYDYLGDVENGEMGLRHAVMHLSEMLQDFAREAGMRMPLRAAMKRINSSPGEIEKS